jgi:ADP-heptose:LPS heptosyltransferase
VNLGTLTYDWQYQARQWLVTRLYHLRRRPDSVYARSAADLPLEPKQVLLIIAGLIGDTVMSTPLIMELRRVWPKAKLVLLGCRHNCDLLSACPLLDDRREVSALPFSFRAGRELSPIKRWLQEQRFDLAIIALGDQFASLLAEAEIPVRVGVQGHTLTPCLTHTYNIGSPRAWGPPERLNALRALGVQVQETAPCLWVSQEARTTARQRLAAAGLREAVPYAVVHPFGSTPRQWWPVDRVGEVADELWSQHGLRTVLIGGPETRGRLQQSGDTRVVDTTGALAIPELLAAVEGAELVISTDSGPFHIAGALGRPIVGLFRARRPEHATRYPQTHVVFGNESSCNKRCRWDRCQSQPCRQLKALCVDELMRAVGQLREALPAAK